MSDCFVPISCQSKRHHAEKQAVQHLKGTREEVTIFEACMSCLKQFHFEEEHRFLSLARDK
jgi:hypothetical protein